MAINTGVNASKVNLYAVVNFPDGVNCSKLNVYAVIAARNVNPPIWPTFLLADGTVGVPYYQAWDLTPAGEPTTYSIVSGAIPGGLTLNSIALDQGSLTGTPITIGTFNFTIRATNAIGYADQAFTVVISPVVNAGGSCTFVM